MGILDTAGVLKGYVDAPWAKDANGVTVPTRFVIEGDTLTQIVDHSSASITYPVVADPKFEWVPGGFVIKYSYAETKAARYPSGALAIAATICAAFGVETLGAACVGAAAESAGMLLVASTAYGDGQCMQMYDMVIPWAVNC